MSYDWVCPCPQCMGTLEPPEPSDAEVDAFLASRCGRVLADDFMCMLTTGHIGACSRYHA